jgi:hypothetical protein
MSGDVATLIEQFFADQLDDGDFSIASHGAQFSFVGPRSDRGRIIYTTKRHAVQSALNHDDAPCDVGMIGRYGLPNRSDVSWLRRMLGDSELQFLGDMDPPDLLIFAWLRAALGPDVIIHFGVNDSLCERLKVVIPDSFTIPLSPSERAALPLLEKVFPDFADTVGPVCAKRLHDGYKVETEAVVSALGSPGPVVQLLTGSGSA